MPLRLLEIIIPETNSNNARKLIEDEAVIGFRQCRRACFYQRRLHIPDRRDGRCCPIAAPDRIWLINWLEESVTGCRSIITACHEVDSFPRNANVIMKNHKKSVSSSSL